jgi:ABC-type Mn2+/Zn2+ transport system ATPase subunit/ribose/xylose/arabinose/galactoside ABC-type transport system permease subunit
MFTILFGTLFDGLPLVPLAVAFVWSLRFQKYADLSLAGSFSVSAACVAYLMSLGVVSSLSILAGLLVGLVVGLLMGTAINWLRIEPLIAGLIILFISYALSLGITQGTIPIRSAANPIAALFSLETLWGFPNGFHVATNFIFFAIAALSVFITSSLLRSEWGCAFRALEDLKGGRQFLRSLGISPAKLSCSGFAIGGMLASVSGILVAMRDQQTTSSLGLDVLIDIIPAYLLGVTLFERRPTLTAGKDVGIQLTNIIKNLFETLRSLSPALSAASGVLLFFFVINLVQQIAPLPWLPRVLMGLILLSLLGLPAGIEEWKRKSRELKSTTIVGPAAALCVDGLSVTYPTWNGNNSILRNVGITALPGEIVQLSGPNGAGKSSLLKALIGEIDSIGHFTVPYKEKKPPTTGRSGLVGYVPQEVDQSIAVTLSVAENAVLSSRGSQVSIFRKWNRSTNAVDLNTSGLSFHSSSLVAWLSGGEKRRVAIALLALRRPSPIVIALDEPFADLDTEGRKRCAEFIESLAARGNIILLIDHQNYIHHARQLDDIWPQADAVPSVTKSKSSAAIALTKTL